MSLSFEFGSDLRDVLLQFGSDLRDVLLQNALGMGDILLRREPLFHAGHHLDQCLHLESLETSVLKPTPCLPHS